MKDVLIGKKNVSLTNGQLIRMKDLKLVNPPKVEDCKIEDEY